MRPARRRHEALTTPCSYMVCLLRMDTLGEKIRALRQKKDLSLREFAARLGGLTAPYLSDIELGRRFPSDEVLAKMAKVLGVPLEDLKRLDTRPPVDDLKRLGTKDPQLGVALRQVIDRKVSGEKLMELLRELERKQEKPK